VRFRIASLTIFAKMAFVNWWEYDFCFAVATRIVLKKSATVASFMMNFSTPARTNRRISPSAFRDRPFRLVGR
jgi:hypothetical protein